MRRLANYLIFLGWLKKINMIDGIAFVSSELDNIIIFPNHHEILNMTISIRAWFFSLPRSNDEISVSFGYYHMVEIEMKPIFSTQSLWLDRRVDENYRSRAQIDSTPVMITRIHRKHVGNILKSLSMQITLSLYFRHHKSCKLNALNTYDSVCVWLIWTELGVLMNILHFSLFSRRFFFHSFDYGYRR